MFGKSGQLLFTLAIDRQSCEYDAWHGTMPTRGASSRPRVTRSIDESIDGSIDPEDDAVSSTCARCLTRRVHGNRGCPGGRQWFNSLPWATDSVLPGRLARHHLREIHGKRGTDYG